MLAFTVKNCKVSLIFFSFRSTIGYFDTSVEKGEAEVNEAEQKEFLYSLSATLSQFRPQFNRYCNPF